MGTFAGRFSVWFSDGRPLTKWYYWQGASKAAAGALSPLRLFLLALLYFAVRCGQPLQTALNRKIADRLPLRSMAACVSFTAGSIGVCGCCAVLFARNPAAWRSVVAGFSSSGAAEDLPRMKWWMPLGGAFGATQVTSTIFLAPRMSTTVCASCSNPPSMFCC